MCTSLEKKLLGHSVKYLFLCFVEERFQVNYLHLVGPRQKSYKRSNYFRFYTLQKDFLFLHDSKLALLVICT